MLKIYFTGVEKRDAEKNTFFSVAHYKGMIKRFSKFVFHLDRPNGINITILNVNFVYFFLSGLNIYN